MKENNIEIKLVKIDELDKVFDVYLKAREFMKKSGNPNQRGDFHPTKAVLTDFINRNTLYKGVNEDGEICFVFAFIVGIDPTYLYIENGKWLNDDIYGTIHALASTHLVKDAFGYIFNFALKKVDNIRIDTHEANKIMLHILDKYNFKRCGIIYVLDKFPRIAFQYSKNTN